MGYTELSRDSVASITGWISRAGALFRRWRLQRERRSCDEHRRKFSIAFAGWAVLPVFYVVGCSDYERCIQTIHCKEFEITWNSCPPFNNMEKYFLWNLWVVHETAREALFRFLAVWGKSHFWGDPGNEVGVPFAPRLPCGACAFKHSI